MAESTWTKQAEAITETNSSGRLKFIIGGAVIFLAIGFLLFNALMQDGATQLYVTVDEFYADSSGKYLTRDIRVSGWVIGDSIKFTQIDATTSRLEFDVVDNINNPGQRLHIVAMNEPLPDLLQHEAQAMVEGRINDQGEFVANSGGLLLKCPTRYEELEPGTYEK